jgi:hypothetical protein
MSRPGEISDWYCLLLTICWPMIEWVRQQFDRGFTAVIGWHHENRWSSVVGLSKDGTASCRLPNKIDRRLFGANQPGGWRFLIRLSAFLSAQQADHQPARQQGVSESHTAEHGRSSEQNLKIDEPGGAMAPQFRIRQAEVNSKSRFELSVINSGVLLVAFVKYGIAGTFAVRSGCT